jgi:hypothetical protein
VPKKRRYSKPFEELKNVKMQKCKKRYNYGIGIRTPEITE